MIEAMPVISNSPSTESFDGNDKPQHECGVFGVWAPGMPVTAMAIEGLSMLQGRGQTSAGVFVHNEDGVPTGTKDLGLVPVALLAAMPPVPGAPSTFDMYDSPTSNGQVRYGTSGGDTIASAQPFTSSKNNLTWSVNGHISVQALKQLKEQYDVDNPETVTDSHDGFLVFDAAVDLYGSVEKALHEVLPKFEGAYCTVVTDGKLMYGARDPSAYHPLCIGELPDGGGYILSSESVALNAVSATLLRDVEPGEIVTIGPEGITSSFMSRKEKRRACKFEYMYTAHPASDIDGSNVYLSRVNAGHKLAEDAPVEADIVIAAPESGRGVAEGFAERSGLPLKQGIIKNNAVQRTFIGKGQSQEDDIFRKYIPVSAILEGKRVVVGDDSVIKGRTMRRLVRLLKQAGAKEVHVRSASPRYEHPCFMGMDTGNTDELIARHMTDEQIAEYIGADSVAYNRGVRVAEAIVEANINPESGPCLTVDDFCNSCETGEYPEGIPEAVNLGIPRVPARPVA